jgi:hypothetical protein
MRSNHASTKSFIRYAYEFLFALNIGLVVRWVMAQANYFESELKIQVWLSAHLHLHPHSQLAGHIAFVLLALEIALAAFVLLEIASYISSPHALPLSIAGIASLIALPLGWVYAARLREPPPGLPTLSNIWLNVELIGTILCAILYILKKWPLPKWAGILLIVLHFALWAWLFPVGAFWLDPFQSVFPLVGLCSSLAWALYLSDRLPHETDAGIKDLIQNSLQHDKFLTAASRDPEAR